MAYATYAQYVALGYASAAQATVEAYLNRASDDMDIASLGKLDSTALETEETAILVKAACAQAEHYVLNGTSSFEGNVSLGIFSMSGAKKPSGMVCDRAMRFLAMIGMTNRSVGTSPTRRLYQLDSGGVIPAQNDEVCE
jgi:hypothetical protein